VAALVTLVLFDIDGTLIQTARAGVRAMNAAFSRLYGRHGALDAIPIAGRTDSAILRDVFAALEIERTAGAVEQLRQAYFEHLPLELARTAPDTEGFGVLPGVERALDALESSPHHTVALLTGNFERSAAIKLGHFDLWRRFAFGAFGDDHVDRRDLVPVALSHAHGRGLTPERVVVVGDTPLDVDCARAHGACAVAVATGLYSREQLAEAGADLVVSSLDDVDLTRDVPRRTA
jgi:phosphoglycolate phosphatase-like HAD superfamily hydrolase